PGPPAADPALGDLPAARRLVDPLCRRRELRELVGGPARPRHQLAAAVRARAPEHRRRARPAERALERADHGVGRVRRQIAITALAARAQLQHGYLRTCTALR